MCAVGNELSSQLAILSQVAILCQTIYSKMFGNVSDLYIYAGGGLTEVPDWPGMTENWKNEPAHNKTTCAHSENSDQTGWIGVFTARMKKASVLSHP